MPNLVQEELERLTYGAPHPDSDDRLGELMLYISGQCQGDPAFGATKLNKLLYYSDMLAFARFGEPLTGAEYRKLPHGPAPRRLPAVRALLVPDSAVVQEADFGGYPQHRLVPLRDAKVDAFKASQIKLVDQVIERFEHVNASEISAFSHDRVWRIADEDDRAIPYEAIFISDEGVTEEDRQALSEIRTEHGG